VNENPGEQVVAAAFKDNKIEIGTTENLLVVGAKVIIGKKGLMKKA